MPDPALRLPPRPSLEQLHKQAKELLRLYRAGDPAAAERFRAVIPRMAAAEPPEAGALADAQFVLAREHGFQSWAKLVHHVETLPPAERLEQFERMAEDILAGVRGDKEALRRLSEHSGSSYSHDRLRELIEEQLKAMPGAEGRTDFTVAEARHLVAREYGFETWPRLAEAMAQPRIDRRATPAGLSSAPPFYRIDWRHSTIEPRPPLTDRDWDVIIDVVKEMGLTGINAGGQMTDAALERVSRLEQVTHLNLNGSQLLSDDGLLHLARMPQLVELDLSGWHSRITDRGLEVLRHLKALRQFQMCWPQRVTDAGVANLTFCDLLESVNLLGTPTGDGAINALTGKRELCRFKSGKLVTDAGLPLLHRFPGLKQWQGGELKYSLMSPDAAPTHLLLDGPFTDHGLRSLAGLDGLFGLSLFWHTTACTADGLRVLAELPNLGFLGCEGNLCNDIAMGHIGAVPRLRMLMAQGTVASDDGFSALSHSPTIEYIWGRECPNLGRRGFAALAAMPVLRGLAVSCKGVDDTALSALPRFPALRELMPMDVSDHGFRHVGRCESLEALWCMYCRETGDVATGHIAGLSRLRTYYAGKTRITDKSLEVLSRIHSLERLEFWETTRITNQGLAALAALPRLREISLSGTRGVTREGLSVFPASVRVTYG